MIILYNRDSMSLGRSLRLLESIMALKIRIIPPKITRREIISPIGIWLDEVLCSILGAKAVKVINQAGNAIEIQ